MSCPSPDSKLIGTYASRQVCETASVKSRWAFLTHPCGYAHMDNVGLIEGPQGWITNLHRALEVKVIELARGRDQFANNANSFVRLPYYIKDDWHPDKFRHCSPTV
jgi:hypothetical protein